jgi:putative lipase involved disintegration of autophagic bodies
MERRFVVMKDIQYLKKEILDIYEERCSPADMWSDFEP